MIQIICNHCNDDAHFAFCDKCFQQESEKEFDRGYDAGRTEALAELDQRNNIE